MIYFVTSNRGKFKEAREIFNNLKMRNLGYTEIQADTLEEVVEFGMKEVKAKLNRPFMIEDAGLFIQSFKGFPGVYSAYVQKTLGNNGILKLMEKRDDRRASFRSVIGYVEPGLQPMMFTGEMHGEIGFQARGSLGFGYDPIFYIGNKSLGEMEVEEKNKISHRGQSMRALQQWIDDR